jgi:hypothetical protein
MMQADKRSFPEWVKTGEWKDPRKSILMGAKALQTKLRSIRLRAGDPDTVTDSRTKRVYKYIIPRVPEAEMLRCALAMYNSGDWALYHRSRGRDFDHGTTGGDYAQDVLNRTKIFKGMLDKHRKAELLKAPIAPGPPPANPSLPDPGEPIKSLKDEVAETAAMPGFKELGVGFLRATFGGVKRIFTWVAGVFTGSETGMAPQLIAVLVVIGLVVAFGVYVYRKRRKAKEVK